MHRKYPLRLSDTFTPTRKVGGVPILVFNALPADSDLSADNLGKQLGHCFVKTGLDPN